MRRLGALSWIGSVALLVACGGGPAEGTGGVAGGATASARIRLATTTSTENSGLLDVLLPAFRAETGIPVEVLSMGTGKALRIAERGDCDVVLVHAPGAEEEFVRRGFGVERRPVMVNDFVIVGPPADPARIRGLRDAVAALVRIRESSAPFCSRGDESGTHEKERSLWKIAGVDPSRGSAGGRSYIETGQGMGATLTQANERFAYTLADRGTFLAHRGRVDLEVLVEGDPRLRNPYAVIAVNPERHPHVAADAVERFIAWLTGPEAKRRIGEYRVGGEVLFHPWEGP